MLSLNLTLWSWTVILSPEININWILFNCDCFLPDPECLDQLEHTRWIHWIWQPSNQIVFLRYPLQIWKFKKKFNCSKWIRGKSMKLLCSSTFWTLYFDFVLFWCYQTPELLVLQFGKGPIFELLARTAVVHFLLFFQNLSHYSFSFEKTTF